MMPMLLFLKFANITTDNRTVSKTTVSKEIELAMEAFELSNAELNDLIIYGFKRSFYHGSYRDKRIYVRRVIDYCDELWQEYMEPENETMNHYTKDDI